MERKYLAPRLRKRPTPYTDTQLRASIEALGVLDSVITYQGQIVDGARRVAIAELLGIPCPRVEAPSKDDAARLLFRAHPDRAWKLFVYRGQRRASIAAMFDVPVDELPPLLDFYRQRPEGKPRRHANWKPRGARSNGTDARD